MKKYILVILVLCAFLIFTGCDKREKILGEDWLLLQESGMEELTTFTENMDDIYALYFSDMISKEDFKQELLMLNHTFNVLQAKYEDLKEQYEIVPESHTYISKKGSEAVDKIRKTLSNMLMDSVDKSGEPKSINELSYLYIAYRDECATYLSEYIVSARWVMDFQEYMDSEFDEDKYLENKGNMETEQITDTEESISESEEKEVEESKPIIP